VVVGTGKPGPFRNVYFPVSETANIYRSGRAGKIKGMRQDAIDDVQPYGGGAGEILYDLHCLDNIDKHRLLLTVWTRLLARSMPASEREKLVGYRRATYPDEVAPDLSHLMAPASNAGPLRVGDSLFTIPDSEIEPHMKVMLGIAFGEPKALEGKPVIETLHHLRMFINAIVFRFDQAGLFR
jgi:hypothetical protein